MLALIASFIRKYIFADWEFAKWIAVLIIVDTVLGLVIAFKKGDINSKSFGKMIGKKFIAYAAVLFIVHALTHFTVGGDKNNLFDWFAQVGYAAVVVRECISILENTGQIAPGLLPAWILKRLKGFDATGKPEDLTNPSNTTSNESNTNGPSGSI